MSTHAPVKWAERKDKLFITVETSNASNVNVKFTEESISVSGEGKTAKMLDGGLFNFTINLKHRIEPGKGSYKVLGQGIEICAIKAESGPYWERLTKEPSKTTKNWLSSDWNLWKDEDEEKEGERVDFGGYGDVSHMVQTMQGGGGHLDIDSDDEDLPPADISDLDK
eukprot:Tbor_TRINITY_DN5083_c0_g4::TRINITY_DN5083_c0_g4_i1::g.14240::m.14240/K15730/PTGES3; cytosolic prostaglandin-E synthase